MGSRGNKGTLGDKGWTQGPGVSPPHISHAPLQALGGCSKVRGEGTVSVPWGQPHRPQRASHPDGTGGVFPKWRCHSSSEGDLGNSFI